jgi:hypothetical protein
VPPLRQQPELFRILALLLLRLSNIHHKAATAARYEVVQFARDLGLPWSAIGKALGLSKQRANNLFRDHTTAPDQDIVAAVEAGQQRLVVFDEDGEAMTYNDLRAARLADEGVEEDDDEEGAG